MPGRKFNGGDYRYGFQGQEIDHEIKGEGNSVNYKYRMHDPRLGRFFAVDPLASDYPHNSPYAFSENRVIDAVELEGLEKDLVMDNIYSLAKGKTKLRTHGSKELADTKLYNNFIKDGALSGDRFVKNVLTPIYDNVLAQDAFTGSEQQSSFYGTQGFHNGGKQLLFGTAGVVLSSVGIVTMAAEGTGSLLLYSFESTGLALSIDDMSTAFYNDNTSLFIELGVDKEMLDLTKTAVSIVSLRKSATELLNAKISSGVFSAETIDKVNTVIQSLNLTTPSEAKESKKEPEHNNDNSTGWRPKHKPSDYESVTKRE